METAHASGGNNSKYYQENVVDTYVQIWNGDAEAGVIVQGSRGSPGAADCAGILFKNYDSSTTYSMGEIVTRSSTNAAKNGILSFRTSANGATLLDAMYIDQNQDVRVVNDLYTEGLAYIIH
jgi:hypothetical protein